MFSNNNYIPDIGQFSNNNTYITQYQQPTGNQGVQFTFAVPTQASSYSLSPAPSSQPRGIYSNPVNQQNIVPGLGTQWQHSVPNPMPWSEGSIPQGSVPAFTAGIPPISSTFSIYNNVPSCSTVPKRPKRHSSTDIETEAPGSKCRATADKMAVRMQGLSLTCPGSPLTPDMNGYQYGQTPLDLDLEDLPCSSMRQDWRKFHEIENRLNSESEDEDFIDQDRGVKVHISKDIAKNFLESPTLLPKEILDRFNKPCMELVLWKSPGGFDRENVKTTEDDTSENTTIHQSIPSSLHTNSIGISNQTINSTIEDYGNDEMEDDQMDL